jgi:arginyl-tRNA synthetase
LQLIKKIIEFPDIVLLAATEKSPHYIATYLKDLASDFHSYYNESKFLIDDANLKKSRIALITAIAIVIQNGLSLLGISAPEKM